MAMHGNNLAARAAFFPVRLGYSKHIRKRTHSPNVIQSTHDPALHKMNPYPICATKPLCILQSSRSCRTRTSLCRSGARHCQIARRGAGGLQPNGRRHNQCGASGRDDIARGFHGAAPTRPGAIARDPRRRRLDGRRGDGPFLFQSGPRGTFGECPCRSSGDICLDASRRRMGRLVDQVIQPIVPGASDVRSVNTTGST